MGRHGFGLAEETNLDLPKLMMLTAFIKSIYIELCDKRIVVPIVDCQVDSVPSLARRARSSFQNIEYQKLLRSCVGHGWSSTTSCLLSSENLSIRVLPQLINQFETPSDFLLEQSEPIFAFHSRKVLYPLAKLNVRRGICVFNDDDLPTSVQLKKETIEVTVQIGW